jgi:hypothetical protein
MLRDEFGEEREQQSASGMIGMWAEQTLMRASQRAQLWYVTVRSYRRAYAKSRHFRRLAD